MVFFTSDLHFFHDRIIQLVHRPFQSGEEMNRALIDNWNRRVGPQDEVYILGDVTMKGTVYATQALEQLQGIKYLVRGNHDQFVDAAKFETARFFQWVRDYADITVGETRFILSHYPFLEWNGFYRGTIHLHGHQHNHSGYNFQNQQQGLRRYDVGVDANYMTPVSAQEIAEFFGP